METGLYLNSGLPRFARNDVSATSLRAKRSNPEKQNLYKINNTKLIFIKKVNIGLEQSLKGMVNSEEEAKKRLFNYLR